MYEELEAIVNQNIKNTNMSNKIKSLTMMEISDFIKTKENAKAHSKEEIEYFIKNLDNFTQEEITQWLKAVKKNGLNDEETSSLTLGMANSGKMLSWEGLEPTLDKHSTGGIGDKVSLIFVPLLAAYGETYGPRVYVPKLSGRALGITGGTIDKLESIDGFRTNLSVDEIKRQVKGISLVISGASSDIAPADKKLYAIRDVTGTTDSIPLIASSIMSKKIAGGAKNIILDVKYGLGAFMKELKDAKHLGEKMVSIGKSLNRNIKAVISNMDQPLGMAVGNSLEIKEVLDVLSGKEITDVVELVTCLAKEAIQMIDPKVDFKLEERLKKLLNRGRALSKFEEMVVAQGGNLRKGFKKAKYVDYLRSSVEGYICFIHADAVGEVVHMLGGGRKNINDNIDHSVGVLFNKKIGDKVRPGDCIVEIHAKNKEDIPYANAKLNFSIRLDEKEKPPEFKLVEEVIR